MPLGSGLNSAPLALAASGGGLFVGGMFTMAGGKVSAFLANADIRSIRAPVIARLALAGGTAALSGTNGLAGRAYSLLVSPSLGVAATNWTRLGTNHFDANGNFAFTNTLSFPQQFYLLQSTDSP